MKNVICDSTFLLLVRITVLPQHSYYNNFMTIEIPMFYLVFVATFLSILYLNILQLFKGYSNIGMKTM